MPPNPTGLAKFLSSFLALFNLEPTVPSGDTKHNLQWLRIPTPQPPSCAKALAARRRFAQLRVAEPLRHQLILTTWFFGHFGGLPIF